LDVWIIRVTGTRFHGQQATGSWHEFTLLDEDGDPATFPGQEIRISFAQYFENLYMADGVNRIWKVDFNSQTVQKIKGAARPKYITTFAERIVAANVAEFVGGIRPSLVVWPVNADPTDWEGLSSGREDLAANDVGDVISGIFGIKDTMVIVRRRSIVHVTRLPFAQSPFSFRTFIDEIGSDLPYSIARVPGGLIWADQRTREVYLYQPGGAPRPLGAAVNRDLYDDLQNLVKCQGAYDPFEREYHLGINRSDGDGWITKTWVFSLEKNAWQFDDSPEVSCLGVVSFPGTSVAIDDLIGTIDAQTGTIDEYGSEGKFIPALLKGTATGEVVEQTYDADDDYDASVFEFEFQSPNMGSISNRRTLKDVEVTADVPTTGSVSIENSNDETASWRNTIIRTISGTAGRSRIRLPRRQITGADLYWRLRATAPGIRLRAWWVRMLEHYLQDGRF
jgi:hypothetical protein